MNEQYKNDENALYESEKFQKMILAIENQQLKALLHKSQEIILDAFRTNVRGWNILLSHLLLQVFCSSNTDLYCAYSYRNT